MADPLNLALHHLLNVLKNQRERHGDRVYLSREARRALRDLSQGKRVAPQASKVESPPAERTTVSLPTVPTPVAAQDAAVREITIPKFPELAVAEVRLQIEPIGASNAEKIEFLKKSVLADSEARPATLRETMVFSVGNPMAKLMFIGEAPGADEESQQEPFVGKAGQLLTKIIGAMGLSREEVYISNICKFRPSIDDQRTNNRKPTSAEMAACLPYIRAEIEVVAPHVIVALGGTALEGLTGETAPISRMRGRVHLWKGVPFIPTFHPSYLLRNQALAERRKVWEDMLLAMELLGMSISDKQRSFFLKS